MEIFIVMEALKKLDDESLKNLVIEDLEIDIDMALVDIKRIAD